MTKFAVTGPELKKMLAKAKQKPINFAYAAGKTPADDYLGMDRLKEAKMILKEARAETKSKAASGSASVDGRDLKLRCETVIPNLARQIKRYLKLSKLSYNVIVMDIDGSVLETAMDEVADGEGDAETPATAPAEAVPERPAEEGAAEAEEPVEPEVDLALKGWLTDRVKMLVPEVKKYATANPNGGPRVVKALKSVQKMLTKNDLAAAQKAIEGLEKLLRVTPQAPALPDAAAAEELVEPEVDLALKGWLTDRVKMLVPEAKKYATANPNGGSRVVEALKSLQKMLTKNDLAAAQKTIEGLEKLLRVTPPPQAPALPDATAEAAEAGVAPDIEPIRQRLQQAFDQLALDLEQFLKRGVPSLTGKASKLAAAFRTEIAGTDMKKAATLVSGLKRFIEANLSQLPPLSKAALAQEAIAAATGPAPAARYEQAAGIMGKYPKGANAARGAMDGFAAVLGDQPVTDQLIADAKTDVANTQAAVDGAKSRLERARALPDGDAKTAAIAEVEADVAAVEATLAACKVFEKAAVSKKALTEALAFGPLSANSAKGLSDDAAAALIEGFTRDPGLAGAALEAASTGIFPDAVALNLSDMIDRKESGFAAGGKQFTNPDAADTYAKQLISMGAHTGPEFFDLLPDYMSSGRQFERDPLKENGVTIASARAQVRSVAVAGALLDPSGRIDTTSPAAKNAIGDLLFNPYSLTHPTPALNAHIIGTLGTFADPDTGPKANGVLDNIPATTPNNAKGLVRRALRKSPTDAVGKSDVQKAVLASMLKPLDQGPVGSCFSTAPCRRMRETDPIAAMEAYAAIAGTGKYKPANGPAVSAVLRIPPNEDPIMRSWEYSTATSTERTKKSTFKKLAADLTDTGLENLGNDITKMIRDGAKADGGFAGFKKDKVEKLMRKSRIKQLKKAIADNVELVYDPTAVIVRASDGKSSQGRYILRRKDTGADIDSANAYGDYVADMVEQVYGLDAASTEAASVRSWAKEPQFANDVTSGDYSPWSLPSGGKGDAATETLFGKEKKAKILSAKGDGTRDPSERTKKVLTDLLKAFETNSNEMLTVETIGMHTFNALPNDPSMEPLKRGGKAKFAENIQRELVDKADALQKTVYDADKTGYLFDRIAAATVKAVPRKAIGAELKKELAARRPTDGKSPVEINALVQAAVTACRPHYPTGKEDIWEDFLKGAAQGKVQTEVIQDAGANEFVIADTNWGDATNHIFFVIAPDPISGDAALFEKTIPPGSLKPSDRDWTDAKWTAMK
ncbi:hypothetical protein [Sulfitobacter geojensis]|uniref:hypothetical protein n=1 Tax=Sulfitobacter geojensis TaxID=1342299 RepID=UPI0036DACC7D